jgi:hypothetical protein
MAKKSEYCLVYWTKDKKYSVIPRSRLNDKALRNLPDRQLWKMRTAARWKKSLFEVVIESCGELNKNILFLFVLFLL